MNLWHRHSTAVQAKPREVAPSTAEESIPVEVKEPIVGRSAALTVLALLVLTIVLQYAQAMIIPIVLGQLIYYALDPVVTALARLRVPRAVGAACVLLAIVAGTGRL